MNLFTKNYNLNNSNLYLYQLQNIIHLLFLIYKKLQQLKLYLQNIIKENKLSQDNNLSIELIISTLSYLISYYEEFLIKILLIKNL